MNKIKELRIERKITQAELAAAINVSPSALSGYETSKFQADIPTYIIIADYFGVSLDYLFGRAEPAEPVRLPAPYPEVSARYGRLDELDKVKALAYMDGMLAAEKYSAASARAVG